MKLEIFDKPLIQTMPRTRLELIALVEGLPKKEREQAKAFMDIVLFGRIFTADSTTGELKINFDNVSNLETKVAFWNLFGARLVGIFPQGMIAPNQQWRLRITYFPGIKAMQTVLGGDIKNKFENMNTELLEIANQLQVFLGKVVDIGYELSPLSNRFGEFTIIFRTGEITQFDGNSFLYLVDNLSVAFSSVLGVDFFFEFDEASGQKADVTLEDFDKRFREILEKGRGDEFDLVKFIFGLVFLILLGLGGLILFKKVVR